MLIVSAKCNGSGLATFDVCKIFKTTDSGMLVRHASCLRSETKASGIVSKCMSSGLNADSGFLIPVAPFGPFLPSNLNFVVKYHSSQAGFNPDEPNFQRAAKLLSELQADMRSKGYSVDAISEDNAEPSDENFAVLSDYMLFIERSAFIQSFITTLKEELSIKSDVDLSDALYLQLPIELKRRSLDVESLKDVLKRLSVNEVIVEKGELFRINDVNTTLSRERDLFLFAITKAKFLPFFDNVISLDQLNALVRTVPSIKNYYEGLKVAYDYATTLDPSFFRAGVTPSEFIIYLCSKRHMSNFNKVKQSVLKSMSTQKAVAMSNLYHTELSSFCSMDLIYKSTRITRAQLPLELQVKVIQSNATAANIELAYNLTIRSFRLYVLFMIKNLDVFNTKKMLLSQDQINALYGFRFTEESWKSYKVLLAKCDNTLQSPDNKAKYL